MVFELLIILSGCRNYFLSYVILFLYNFKWFFWKICELFFEERMRIIEGFFTPIIFNFVDFVIETFKMLLMNFFFCFMTKSFRIFENWKWSFKFFSLSISFIFKISTFIEIINLSENRKRVFVFNFLVYQFRILRGFLVNFIIAAVC